MVCMGGGSSTRADLTHGAVAPGFENVQKMFEQNVRSGGELQAQLCVFVGGRQVVDLWGSSSPGDGFSGDSLINSFSSSKSLTCIAMARLVEMGLLSYDQPISKYWPEFAANGKSQITVAQLMRHEAGLPFLETSIQKSDLLTKNIKNNKIGELIEKQGLIVRNDGEPRQYHALTRGWVANEIFRRVHPEKITIGDFFRIEIAEKIGADVHIGLSEGEIEQVFPIKMAGLVSPVCQSFIPKIFGRPTDLNIFDLHLILFNMMKHSRTNRTPAPPIEGMGFADTSIVNTKEFMMGEIPSGNGHASARGLAKIASAMANNGVFENHQILGEEALSQLHSAGVAGDMVFHKNIFTKGGVAMFGPVENETKVDRIFYENREGFYGWYGLGGSIMQWHPKLRIGFAYLPTLLSWVDMANNRGGKFQKLIMEIVRSNP